VRCVAYLEASLSCGIPSLVILTPSEDAMSLRLTTSHENRAVIPAQAGIHPDLRFCRGDSEEAS
jgi:hypothetical protein